MLKELAEALSYRQGIQIHVALVSYPGNVFEHTLLTFVRKGMRGEVQLRELVGPLWKDEELSEIREVIEILP